MPGYQLLACGRISRVRVWAPSLLQHAPLARAVAALQLRRWHSSFCLACLQILCECLVYACCIRQRLTAADITDLVDLLHRLGLKARAAAGDLAAQQQAYVVLFAVLLTLLPLENAEGAGGVGGVGWGDGVGVGWGGRRRQWTCRCGEVAARRLLSLRHAARELMSWVQRSDAVCKLGAMLLHGFCAAGLPLSGQQMVHTT